MEKRRQKGKFDDLRKRLEDPFQLRIFICSAFFAVAYVGIFLPFGGRLDQSRRALKEQRDLRELAREVESMRAQVEMFRDRLPSNADTNEWIQYVLEGIRQYPLKLVNMDSGKTRRVGIFKAVALGVELEGEMADLDALLSWLESDQRIFRVDSVKIAPARADNNKKNQNQDDDSALVMQLIVLGLNA